MAISQQSIGTGATTLYTSVGTTTTTAIYLMNDHSGGVVVQIHIVPSAGSASTSNKIIKDLTIAAGDTYILDTERLILANGDTIQASADVGSVVYSTISYIGV